MRGARLHLAAIAVAMLAASGCAMTYDARQLGVPVTMSSAAGQPVVGDSFVVRKRAVHLLWGVVSGGTPSLQNALAAQLADGKAIADLRIRTKSRFSDLLFTVLTLGLVVPRTVTYEGVVVSGTP